MDKIEADVFQLKILPIEVKSGVLYCPVYLVGMLKKEEKAEDVI